MKYRFYLLVLAFLGATSAQAGQIELSAGFSFNRTKYSDSAYTWSRRYSLSVGYQFAATSLVELQFQDATTRTNFGASQDTTFYDNVYSINYVQLIPVSTVFQPYVKVGLGQLNRNGDGIYGDGSSPPAQYDNLTGVLGMGFRLYLRSDLALKIEATTYLYGAQLSTWKDNPAMMASLTFVL